MMGFVARYLWEVSPHFSHAVVVSSGLACFGFWVVRTLPSDVGAAYVPILFYQAFGASSGFRPMADRGTFDALLVSGAGRGLIAAMHWALSAGPGMLAWAAVGAVEVGHLGTGEAVGLRPQSVVGLFLVSTIAWAVTLPAARFTGGVLWVLSIGLLAALPEGVGWLRLAVELTPDGEVQVWSAVAAFLVCPFLLLVPALQEVSTDPRVLGSLGSISAVTLTGGAWWVVVRDYPGRA